MGEYRHRTDKQRTVLIGSCPEGCQEVAVEVGGGAPEDVDDYIESFQELIADCPDCGRQMGYVRQDMAEEVLE
jgi:hypothetical protein